MDVLELHCFPIRCLEYEVVSGSDFASCYVRVYMVSSNIWSPEWQLLMVPRV